MHANVINHQKKGKKKKKEKKKRYQEEKKNCLQLKVFTSWFVIWFGIFITFWSETGELVLSANYSLGRVKRT